MKILLRSQHGKQVNFSENYKRKDLKSKKGGCIRSGRDWKIHFCFPVSGSGFYRHRGEYIIHGRGKVATSNQLEHAPGRG